jgi:predicted transcriptional regulator YdeE
MSFEKTPPVQLTEVPGFTVIGPFVRTTNAVEMSGEAGKIGPLWSRFMQGDAETIPGVIDPQTIYAVYANYESDETGAYDLVVGRSVQPDERAPEGMKLLNIQDARYLVFPVAGRSPDSIKEAWMSIYDYFAHHGDQQRAYTCDFEQHSTTETKIFIAIR